ncbi:MAG: hypothetical protein LBB26_00790 [Puniceicoccales bacterium]|nr:hypothetical protein [Puniceicoccales bacterium]
MKKVTAEPLTDIFNGNWGLPTFQHTRLTPAALNWNPRFYENFLRFQSRPVRYQLWKPF